MASLYQSKENNKNLLEERLSSSLTTQWNRAPYGVQRGTTCSVWCFPIKKQKQTALQGKQPNSLNGIYQQIQGLNKNGRVSTFFFNLNQQNKVLGRSTVVFAVDNIFPRWMPKFYRPFRCHKWFLADASTPRWHQVSCFYYAFWVVVLPHTSFWHCYCTRYIPKKMTKLLQHLERDSCLYRQSPGKLLLGRETR